jgi:adenylate kinase
LMQRSDDTRETVENRLAVYEAQTAPLIAYYRQRGLLSDIDGAGKVEQVQQRVVELLSANGLV